jgi:glycosyltransferase involved in cell wall biosynthesis
MGNVSWWWRARCLVISLVMVFPISWNIIRWKSTIVSTNTITIFSGALAAMITRRPHIWHIQEFGYEDHGYKFLLGGKWSKHLMDRMSVVCIAASNALANKYQEVISPSKLKVIYYGLCQSVSGSLPVSYATQKSSPFKCMIVGKISEGKNQEEAIKAVAELVNKGMNIELDIIGDGYPEYIDRLNNIIQENGIQKSIRFGGYHDDVFAYMCNANVILMCSRCEGLGRVTVEGMLARKPIIGARSGATIELVEEGVRGLLYSPGDYKDLANKIEYFYSNPVQARLMGENAQEWAMRNFSEERFGMDLVQVLLNVSQSGTKHDKLQIKESSKS